MKKTKTSLWKLSLAVGVLLGVGIKIFDYVKAGFIRCGVFSPAEACSGFVQYLKELPIWIILGIIAAFVLIYGIRYVIAHIFHSAKNMPDLKSLAKKKVANEKIKEKAKKEVSPKKEAPKKVIKI